MNYTIIDGWNLFSYEGIPNDEEKRKTVAVKSIGESTAEILLNFETMKFEYVKDGKLTFSSPRFSSCMKMADTYFDNIGE